MHFSTIIAMALLGASTTMAVPAMKRNNQLLCPGLPGDPQCCAVNALNVADLNCGPRTSPSCSSSLHIYPYFAPYIFFYIPRKTAANLVFLFLVPAPASNVSQFTQVCAAIGQQAQCCVLPVVSVLFFECYADAWNWADQSDAVGPSPALPESPGPVSGDSFPF